MISKQRSISSMSRARAAVPVRLQAAQNSRTGSPTPLGPNQSLGRPGQRLFEQGRNEERVRDEVEDSHDGGVVAGGPGERDGLVGERLATLEGTLRR